LREEMISMAKLKTLVVGEIDTIGSVISILLQREGFDVTIVDSFRSAEETYAETKAELSRNQYDVVVLTNNGLPPKKILELIPEVNGKHPDIKIIVLSTWDAPEFLKNLREQGIHDFLSMPFVPDDLMRRLKAILMR
jgi:DNA-binding response OmpR family regulator